MHEDDVEEDGVDGVTGDLIIVTILDEDNGMSRGRAFAAAVVAARRAMASR